MIPKRLQDGEFAWCPPSLCSIIGTTAALIMGGLAAAGTVAGASISSNAAKSAANTQAQVADKSLALQQSQYDTTRADLAPWRAAGSGALQMLSDSLGLNGPAGNARGTAAFQKSPGYDFAMSEGLKGVDAGAYARGTGRSGATYKAETRFAQGTANQEFGGWLGKLGTVAGFGQSATQTGASAGSAFAVNAGNTVQDAAAARASGYVGSANAVSGGINSLAKLAGNFAGGSLTGGYTNAGGGMFGGQYYAPFDSAAAAAGY